MRHLQSCCFAELNLLVLLFAVLVDVVILGCKGPYEPIDSVSSWKLACENIRFSSLFVAGDVLCGGTSATQRQKFHTDDVKSVRNPIRSADWSTQQLHCFSYCLWMTDKRQKATKVKCKRKESLTKQSILWNIVFSWRSIWVLLELVGRWTQHFTKIDQKTRKIGKIYVWNPMNTGFIM